MNPSNNYDEDEADVDDNYDPEAEVGFDNKGAPVLPQVPVVTGEESDETLTKFRAKIYRWHDSQWKERGAGDLKFLQNINTKKVRIVMRQDKTGKLIANHFIQPTGVLCKLTAQKTTDKAWLWTCYDLSDDTARVERLCARFTTVEEFQRFQKEFEAAYELNKAAFEVAVQEGEEVKKSE